MNAGSKRIPFKIVLALLCALSASLPAHALDIAGAHFDDKTSVATSELTLNGAGVRTKLFFKIYAIGLYLPQKTDGADAVLASKGPRRIQIVTLRDLTAEQLTDAFIEALNANHSEQEMSKLAARVERFRATMLSIGKAADKTVIRLDYLPASGTRLTVGNEQKGSDIAGEDFFQALLRIWLGNAPAQADIKEKLAGKN
ncbi:chalcone isomerase family protein [Uliginosibacterium sp. H3]|uniref:Chalcone isomerase family protein n=1 Tax=Uliginosibacterium silvisoli TaxID=3114758 RepID=A0ABU6K3Q6_9RHOO|nr:chalcone isomerase family protein [Uliginosibacterium sp. H3]